MLISPTRGILLYNVHLLFIRLEEIFKQPKKGTYMTTFFVIGLLLSIGYALFVVKVKNPYLMLLATLAYLIYFVPMGFAFEKHGKLLSIFNGELGKLLAVIIAVISGGLISIALTEIRVNHIKKQSSTN